MRRDVDGVCDRLCLNGCVPPLGEGILARWAVRKTKDSDSPRRHGVTEKSRSRGEGWTRVCAYSVIARRLFRPVRCQILPLPFSVSPCLRVCSENRRHAPKPCTGDAVFIIESAAKASFSTPWCNKCLSNVQRRDAVGIRRREPTPARRADVVSSRQRRRRGRWGGGVVRGERSTSNTSFGSTT